MKNRDLSQIDCYNYNKILVVRLDCIYGRRYIKRRFKKKNGNMSSFYSYQKAR